MSTMMESMMIGFEKIKEGLKEASFPTHEDYYALFLDRAVEVVNQVAEEYSSSEKTNMSENLTSSEEFCEWSYLYSNEENAFETECGSSFWFEGGGISENGFKFCPYCGKEIKVVEHEYDN